MPNFDRALWRTASRVVAVLEARRRHDLAVALPNQSWSKLQSLVRQLDHARQRGWTAAAGSIRQSLHLRLQWLTSELEALVAETADAGRDFAPGARDVYEDLRALQTRFDPLEIDLAKTKLSVTTESITLDDVELGPFQLVWNWSRLDHDDALTVIAVEPYYAAGRDSVTHPHVQDEVLCEGEARRSLRRALRTGRLLDYFEIVERVLQTYNSGSAYVSLAEWDCPRCPGCDEGVDADDLSSCEDCDDRFCPECLTACTNCGCVICRSCAVPCVRCEESLCRHCRSTRPGLPRCDACFHKELTHEDNPTPTPATAVAPAELAVHADSLGEALALRDAGDTEIGGFGISRPDDLLCVEDLALVSQETGPASVVFDDLAVAEFFEQQIDAGRPPAEFGRIWIHTHPGASPQPSDVDEATFARVFGRCDWAVMAIVARGGAAYARLSWHIEPGGAWRIPVEVDFSRPFAGSDQAAWQAEYQHCVRPFPAATRGWPDHALLGSLPDEDLSLATGTFESQELSDTLEPYPWETDHDH